MTYKQRIAALLAALLLAGCELTALPQATPTPAIDQITAEPTPTQDAALPTPSPSAPTLPPQLESPVPSDTPGPPTATATATETPGPYEYVIQQSDTLYYIIQLPPWSYTDYRIIDEVLRLNPHIVSIDRLPGAGSTILIPRPTPTPLPEGFDLTLTADPSIFETVNAPTPELLIGQVEVREGITMIGIAQEYETTLRVLSDLNPDIAFINCDFSNPSGGEGCNVPLSVGQIVNVPAPTPTPTLSPTFSGSETPTPTPTYSSPNIIFPPNGADLTGGVIPLQWLSAGILQPGEQYLVQVEDTTSGATHLDVTRATSYTLPGALTPTDGQPHTIRWRVGIAALNAEGTAYRFIGADPAWQSFTWRVG
jgi:hypothetical protein